MDPDGDPLAFRVVSLPPADALYQYVSGVRGPMIAAPDLAVTDPYGDRIDYYTDGSPSGGRLDVDANYPCPTGTTTPVENVFWPPGGAPAGPYSVEVAYRNSCGTPAPQDFELVIRLDGEVAQDIHQTITYGQPLTFQFDYGSPG